MADSVINTPETKTIPVIIVDEMVLDSILSNPEDYERAEGVKAYLRQCGVMEA